MSVNAKRRQARHPAPGTMDYVLVSSVELKKGRVQWSIPLTDEEMAMSSGDAGRHRYRVWLTWSKETRHYVVNYPLVVAGAPAAVGGYRIRRCQFQARDIATARAIFEEYMRDAATRLASDVLLGTTGGGQ